MFNRPIAFLHSPSTYLHNILISGKCLTKPASKDQCISFSLDFKSECFGHLKKSCTAHKRIISLFVEFLWEVETISTVSTQVIFNQRLYFIL